MLRPLRIGDPAICRCSCNGKPCVSGVILKNNSAGANVLIENQLAAVVGDLPYGCFGCACLGCPAINTILTGSNRILVGNMPLAHQYSLCNPFCIKGKSLAKIVYIGI